MTGYLTTLSGSYGVGNYVASASSEYGVVSNPAWYAFDKSGTLWTSNLGYNSTTGAYNAANVTVATTGTAYFGEWLQLQQPVSTVLSTYSILDRGDVTYESPNTFYILGSRDGTNWTLVDSQSGITWSANQTRSFTVSTTQAFNYYRLVTNIINVSGGTPTRVSVGEWVLNGSIQGAVFTPDGRLGLGVTAPTQALEVAGNMIVNGTVVSGTGFMFRNRIINGDFRIAQRGTSVGVPTTTGTYLVDRWTTYTSISSGSMTYYQNVLSSTESGPYQQGFRYAANLVCTSTIANSAVNLGIIQPIEGYNCTDIGWGTSAGVPVTVSFWFKSNQTGFTSFGFRNQDVFSITYTSPAFNYPVASVWQYYSVTVPPPPTGYTWQNNTNLGSIGLYLGGNQGTQTGSSSSVGGWSTGTSAFGYNNQINYLTTGNYIAFTGVQLEKGSVATPYEVRPYATELALCQRYYEQSYSSGTAPGTSTYVGTLWFAGCADNAGNLPLSQRYAVPKRIAVNPTFYSRGGTVGQWDAQRSGASGLSTVTVSENYSNEFYFRGYVSPGGTWVAASTYGHWVANAEL
jgi:hypothetical protein